jgi:SAM-dependent methyltransferase
MHDDTVRNQVSEAYANALAKAKERKGSCCAPAPTSTSASYAGYGSEADTYRDAAGQSFGCGNPLAFAQVLPNQTVVDLGAGAGFDLLIAADRVGPGGKVIGVDMTDAMIEAARTNALRAGKHQIELRKGTIEALPVETGTVDWVISNCVINLSPDKDAVFREIARVLKPGGRFSVSDIVAEGLPDAVRSSAQAYSACIGGAISEAAYTAGLERAGLVGIQVTDRHVYDADALCGIVMSDLEWAGADPTALEAEARSVAGKVWSVRIEGAKPR